MAGPTPTLAASRGAVHMHGREFGARSDAEFLEDVAQVEVHRPWTQEELGSRVAVAHSLPDQRRDLTLLWRQLVCRSHVPATSRLARRPQLLGRTSRKALRTQVLED